MEALQFFSSIGEETQMFLGSRMTCIDVEAGEEAGQARLSQIETGTGDCLWAMRKRILIPSPPDTHLYLQTNRACCAGVDLCHEGERTECLWLLERGAVLAFDLSCKPQHTLFAPAMLGDAILIADKVPTCRERIYGYRADTPCRCLGIFISSNCGGCQ